MKEIKEKIKVCRRCGECCQTKGIMRQSSLIEKIIYRLVLFLSVGFRGLKNPKCKYLRFRSRNAYCAIYDKRPDFCKEYFCDKAKQKNEKRNQRKNNRDIRKSEN